MKTIYFVDNNPNVTVLISSPSLRQSMIMFDCISMFVFSSSYLHNKVIRATRTQIQFENGSCIIALPCSEHMLRGYTANMVILDEASWIPENIITQILFPMLSTTDGYAIFLSTPWDRNHFFYRAFCNPNYSVHKVKSCECPLIKPEFLQEMRLNMTKDAYMTDYEAEFVDAFNSFFPKDLISECVAVAQKLELDYYTSLESPIQKGEYYGGVDLGKLQDSSVISILKREDDLLKLMYVCQFPLESSYSNVIGSLVAADRKFGFRSLVVDQTGVGEPVLEEIHNQGLKSADGLKFTVQTKEDLLGRLKIIMEQKRLAIPYHRQLCQQINEQQFERTKSGHLQFSHPANSHDDMLWSLALAVYAAVSAVFAFLSLLLSTV
jgi:phage FluMu gp28-like protein